MLPVAFLIVVDVIVEAAMQDKISRTLRKRFASNREGIQDLTEKSTRGQAETAIEWLHSLEMGGPFLPESVRAFAKLMPSDILSKDRLAEKATSNLLVEHFPAARLKRIISAAQKVLARTGAESDAPLSDVSSGTAVSREDVAELTKIQIVGEVNPLTFFALLALSWKAFVLPSHMCYSPSSKHTESSGVPWTSMTELIYRREF